MKSVQPNQLPLVERDPQPAPQAAKKKKAKKGGQTKAASARLEGFVDLKDLVTSELVEEMEDNMFNLVVGFAVRVCKRVVSS